MASDSITSPTMIADGNSSCGSNTNNYYTAPTISFDDMSTREDFLLMLVSTSSGSIVQRKNQKRALTILQACGVEPEILDAADPSNATVRDELCQLSGMKGRYPQFFLVQGDQTEFFSDFDDLEQMNEEGTLAEWLGMEIPCPSPKRATPKNLFECDSSPNADAMSRSKDNCFTVKKRSGNDDDDGTETTHPDNSHAGSSFDSHSMSNRHPPLYSESLHSQDSERAHNIMVQECNDPVDINAGNSGNASPQQSFWQVESGCGLATSHPSSSVTLNASPVGSPQNSPRDDMGFPSKSIDSHHDAGRFDVISEPLFSEDTSQHEDGSFLEHFEDTPYDLHHESRSIVSITERNLQSLLSCDESVDTTATASSIVTNSRVSTMDLDLRIHPSTDIHFLLTHNSDDTSRCSLTLSNMSMSYLPLTFRIQASHRHRYMIWPSIGLVKPQSTISVSVFLLDEAKQDLLNSFRTLGPAAEFRCTDTLSIEWCGAPSDFCNQLTADHEQDMETLLSYWNSCMKNEGWTCEQCYLRVRVSVDDDNRRRYERISEPVSPNHSFDTRNDEISSPSSDAVSHKYNEMLEALQAEVENLRRKCEEMTAERYILEQQLEEVRERNSLGCGGAIHKFQLQQTMRCGNCLKVFRSDPNSLLAPIASQSCGHSICRNCCYQRSSRYKRHTRHSLSSDLLMCVGDLQSLALEDYSCPICQAPSAFEGSKLNVNHSLCLVLHLLDK